MKTTAQLLEDSNASLATATARVTELEAQISAAPKTETVTALNASVTRLTGELATASGNVTRLTTENQTLTAENTKLKSEATTVKEAASAKAVEMVAAVGIKPLPKEANTGRETITRAEFDALSPVAKSAHLKGGGRITN